MSKPTVTGLGDKIRKQLDQLLERTAGLLKLSSDKFDETVAQLVTATPIDVVLRKSLQPSTLTATAPELARELLAAIVQVPGELKLVSYFFYSELNETSGVIFGVKVLIVPTVPRPMDGGYGDGANVMLRMGLRVRGQLRAKADQNNMSLQRFLMSVIAKAVPEIENLPRGETNAIDDQSRLGTGFEADSSRDR